MHFFQIRHGPSHHGLGHFQLEFIIRFQKDRLCLHQSLSDSPVGCLPKVSAFRMFRMGSSGRQRDLHICQRRPGQNAAVLFLIQMGQNQPLPVSVQIILAAGAFKHHAAASRTRLQNQMNFRIVAQGLEMPDALYPVRYGFTVQNLTGSEFHIGVKTIRNDFL